MVQSEPAYYTRIPNMIEDDVRLDAFAVRVYLHYRRRAGESGSCEDGIRQTAAHCRISHPIVQRSKAALIAAGYIKAERQHRGDGRWVEAILICDVWAENRTQYTRETELHRETTFHASVKPDDRMRETTLHAEEVGSNDVSRQRETTLHASVKRSGTIKKNPVKNLKEHTTPREKGMALLADAEFTEELRADFPKADIPYESKKWLDYIEGTPPKGNYKNSLRNWLERSRKFAEERGTSPPTSQRNGTGPPAPYKPVKAIFNHITRDNMPTWARTETEARP